MKARKKPLETIEIDSLGIDTASRLTVVSVAEPSERKEGVKVNSAAELVEKLKTEAKVI